MPWTAKASPRLLFSYAKLIQSLEGRIIKILNGKNPGKKILLLWVWIPLICPMCGLHQKINWPDRWAERVSSCSYQNPVIYFSSCKTLFHSLHSSLQAKKEKEHSISSNSRKKIHSTENYSPQSTHCEYTASEVVMEITSEVWGVYVKR